MSDIRAEEALKDLGFESSQEFHKLVAAVDLSTPEKLEAFKLWQYGDGTKDGLLQLMQEGAT